MATCIHAIMSTMAFIDRQTQEVNQSNLRSTESTYFRCSSVCLRHEIVAAPLSLVVQQRICC